MVASGPTMALAAVTGATAVLAAGVSALSWARRDKRGATGLALANAMATLWLAGYALELASGTLGGALFWHRIKVLGLNGIPIAWLLFAVDYTETDRITRWHLAALAVVPLTNVGLVLTNGWVHTLNWTAGRFVENGPFQLLALDFGVAWWFNVAYSYVLITIAIILLVRYRLTAVHFQRRQTDLILLSGLPITPANAFYYLDIGPFPALDFTPFTFVFAGLSIFWGIFRYRLFDLSPVARRTVVEDMDDAMFVLDRDGRITDLNPTARTLCREANPLGEQAGDVLPPLGTVLRETATRLADGATSAPSPALDPLDYATESADLDTDEVAIDHDGDRRVYDVKVSYLRDRSDDVTGLTVVLHDITERTRRTETLAALQTVTQDLMRAETVDGVCERVVHAASDVVGLQYVTVYRHEAERLEPVAATDDVSALYEDPPSVPVGAGLAGTAFERGETVVYDGTGDVQPRDAAVSIERALLVPLGEYGVLGAVAVEPVAIDEETVHFAEVLAASASTAIARADREEAVRERERELRRQNERLDDFANVVSHDLRNPLSVAYGHVEQVEQSEHADATKAALKRMEEIIDDVLTLARQGGPVDETATLSLGDVARTAWEVAETGDADLRTEDCRIEADESRLQQLLENLFRNSVDHGGTDVTVRVGPLEGGFYVEDDGPGIPEDERNQVFDSGFSTESDGTGLGLSIVSRIVEDHGWSIRVTESEVGGVPASGDAPDEFRESGGARFEITGATTPAEQ
ncbi:histidine kinase N-terminal 7TM domain-containing protein [Halorientalis salina]|uniref:histidine kinase N-terminal 7TM domain-containing protein n=1 Tax=Halorientalis salina TaxID=2932266 RepID=UPI0010AD5282|nr:histidine kinase N-terminal 7TM domain-containing protein [Halorientalis salina]